MLRTMSPGRNWGLFLRWLLSYLSILLIPVILGCVLSSISMRTLVNEATANNEAMLRHVQRGMDEKAQSMKQTVYQLAMDQNLAALLGVKGHFSNADQYGFYQLIRRININLSTVPFVDNVFIYLKSTDAYVTKNAKMSPSYFYNYYFTGSLMSREQVRELMAGQYAMKCRVIEMVSADGGKAPALLFLQSLPLANSGATAGTIAGVIQVSGFLELTGGLDWMDDCEFMMLDSSGEALLSSGPESLPHGIVRDMAERNALNETVSYRGGSYILTALPSTAGDWKYVIIMPTTIFEKKTEFIRDMTVYGFVLCILIGGVVAYFFAKSNSDPLNRIVQLLIRHEPSPDCRSKNDYDFIHDVVNKNLREIREANSRLESQKATLQQNVLANLLAGKLGGLPAGEELSRYGIDLRASRYAVLLLSIEDLNALKVIGKEGDDLSARKLAAFALSNSFREKLERLGKCWFVELDEWQAFIVGFAGAEAGNDSIVLSQAVRECQQYIHEHLHIYITASVSGMHDSWPELPEAYHEALEAMEYRRLIGSGDIIRYEDIDNHHYTYNYSLQTEQILINHIRVGDCAKAREVLDDVIRRNLSDASFSGEMARCLMFDLTSTIVRTMYESCDASFIEDVQPLKRMRNCETVIEMKQQIMLVLELVCEDIRRKSNMNSQTIQMVIEYINNHYADVNLSIVEISQKHGLTRSYLSMLFKNKTGKTLLDHITTVRLDRAKALLKGDKASITETARAVGYSNSSVFIRVFRKYEGVTPGEYKTL